MARVNFCPYCGTDSIKFTGYSGTGNRYFCMNCNAKYTVEYPEDEVQIPLKCDEEITDGR